MQVDGNKWIDQISHKELKLEMKRTDPQINNTRKKW